MVEKIEKGNFYILEKDMPNNLEKGIAMFDNRFPRTSTEYTLSSVYYTYAYYNLNNDKWYRHTYGTFCVGMVYLAAGDGILFDENDNYINVTEREKLDCFSHFDFSIEEEVSKIIKKLEEKNISIKLTPFSAHTFKCSCWYNGYNFYNQSIGATQFDALRSSFHYMKKMQICALTKKTIRFEGSTYCYNGLDGFNYEGIYGRN